LISNSYNLKSDMHVFIGGSYQRQQTANSRGSRSTEKSKTIINAKKGIKILMSLTTGCSVSEPIG
jgi:hypothetical protein